MPQYEFECQACRTTFDLQLSFAEYAAKAKEKKIVCRRRLALCNRSVAHPLRPRLLMLVRMRSRPRFSSTSAKDLPPQKRSSAWSPKVPNYVS